MNILNDHAHMRIGTRIVKYHNENVCVPGQQTATRYQETGLVHN